jgi:hypothetical protein
MAGFGHVLEVNPADIVGLHGVIPHSGHPVEEIGSYYATSSDRLVATHRLR